MINVLWCVPTKKKNLNLKLHLRSTVSLWVIGTALRLILNQQTEWQGLNGRGKGWNIIEPCTDQFTHYEYQGSFWERRIVRGNPAWTRREPLESPHRTAKRPDAFDLKHNMYKRRHQGLKPLTGSNFFFLLRRVESPLASHQKKKKVCLGHFGCVFNRTEFNSCFQSILWP